MKGSGGLANVERLLLLALIFAPRLAGLDVFLTADEPLFLEHSREFAAGLSSGDLGRTLGIGYPGVTLAWWSAAVTAPARTDLAAYVAGRFVTALVTGLLLVVFYRLGRVLLGRWPAFLGAALLALDPYSLAYSRLLHIEAALALLMTLAGLACLLWLGRGGRRWLLLAGLFTGLALLTKSTALLLGPLLGLLAVVGLKAPPGPPQGDERGDGPPRPPQGGERGDGPPRPPQGGEKSEVPPFGGLGGPKGPVPPFGGLGGPEGPVPPSGGLGGGPEGRQIVAGLVVILAVAGLVFFVLWPAMWSQPGRALGLTFGKLFTDQEAGAGNLGLFWLGRFVDDPGPLFYPVAFVLKATPWLLAGLGASLWSTWRERGSIRPASLGLWLFGLGYLAAMTIASKKSIRYMLPAFPVFYLLAGLAFYRLGAGWRAGRVGEWFAARPGAGLGLGGLALLGLTLLYHPYYFTYYNPLVLGWRWAPQTLLVGWGEGLDGAARFLDGQPPGDVAAWYEWLWPPFYRRQVEPLVPRDKAITAGRVVFYINQVQRDIPDPNLVHYFRTRRRPVFTARLAGIDYAWVYSGPVAGPRPDPAPQYPIGGDFGGEMRLAGYDLLPSSPAGPLPGEPLVVTLYWRVLAPPPAERFVYLRLVDADGQVWARADSPPVMGLWPAALWQPGHLIEDAQELHIPAGTPPGIYRLEAGLYDPASGQALAASYRPVGLGGGLLLGEVAVGWSPRPVAPDLPRQVDVRLGPDVRLAGYEAPPGAATTGDVLTIRLGWREARPLLAVGLEPSQAVLFYWRPVGEQAGPNEPARQMEPLPLPVDRWGRGALLLSQHPVIVPPGLAAGRYELAAGLQSANGRPAGETFVLGQVTVDAPPHEFKLPPGAVSPAGAGQLAGGIELAGYKLAPAPDSLRLALYWRTRAALPERYTAFAQLLAANGDLVAQSDQVPAAGQRPTTGWLPGEVIADGHSLALPAGLGPGTYRLIAGLYDPTTGRRLEAADIGTGLDGAILVSEVDLP